MNHLGRLLRLAPQGALQLEEGTVARAELEAQASALDDAWDQRTELLEEVLPDTAEETLSDWERVYGIQRGSDRTTAQRQARVQSYRRRLPDQTSATIGQHLADVGEIDVPTFTEPGIFACDSAYSLTDTFTDVLDGAFVAFVEADEAAARIAGTDRDELDDILEQVRPAHTIVRMRSDDFTCDDGWGRVDWDILEPPSADAVLSAAELLSGILYLYSVSPLVGGALGNGATAMRDISSAGAPDLEVVTTLTGNFSISLTGGPGSSPSISGYLQNDERGTSNYVAAASAISAAPKSGWLVVKVTNYCVGGKMELVSFTGTVSTPNPTTDEFSVVARDVPGKRIRGAKNGAVPNPDVILADGTGWLFVCWSYNTGTTTMDLHVSSIGGTWGDEGNGTKVLPFGLYQGLRIGYDSGSDGITVDGLLIPAICSYLDLHTIAEFEAIYDSLTV